MEQILAVEALVRENMRLRKIEAAAIKVSAFMHGYHHSTCDAEWGNKPCDCGFIELAESLVSEEGV